MLYDMMRHALTHRLPTSYYGYVQTIKEFIEKVKAGGNQNVSLYMYPGEGHGFMNGGKDIHEKMKSEPFTPISCLCAFAQPCSKQRITKAFTVTPQQFINTLVSCRRSPVRASQGVV